MIKTVVFTDGACSGNPGPGGWAALMIYHGDQQKELGGSKKLTTNNEMELLAVLETLKLLTPEDAPVGIYLDSSYVMKGITQWLPSWKKQDWKTRNGDPLSHEKIWQAVDRELSRFSPSQLRFILIPAHSGIPGNERVDELSVAFSQQHSPPLRHGKLADPSLLSLKAKPGLSAKARSKAKAHTYLSLVNGVLKRHSTWAECEKQVKGKSGAKFKKAISAEDEEEILRGWGIK